MSLQWFVRKADDDLWELDELHPLAFDEFIQMRQTGKLAATDLVKAPGESEWQRADTIKGLFRDHNDIRFRTADEQMKNGSLEALHEAVVALSEIINDQASSHDDERNAFWKRGECQRQLARHSFDLTEVIAFFQSALRDFSQSVYVSPYEFSRKMSLKSRWFPEHPMYLPAYKRFLHDISQSGGNDRDSVTIEVAAAALGRMGREAADAIPELKAALPCAGMFKLRVESTIQRIAQRSRTAATDELQNLFDRVEDQLQVYPTGQDRFDLEHPLTEDDLKRSELELVALFDDEHWAVRAKSACILRCKVRHPKGETIRALFDHLDRKERRGNVRGQCASTLAHFASEGEIQGNLLDRLITALRELLDGDPAYAVQAIAAEALADIAPHLHEVVTSLISALSKPKLNVNLERALVRALGMCGPDAETALPLILRFTPHHQDVTGGIVKAAAIVGIAPTDHPASRKSLKTIIENRMSSSREIQAAVLDAFVRIRMDDLLRKKLILYQMFFSTFAKLRYDAARALIAIDKEFATKAGAYLLIDRIGRS